jgi:hypothetical protein
VESLVGSASYTSPVGVQTGEIADGCSGTWWTLLA